MNDIKCNWLITQNGNNPVNYNLKSYRPFKNNSLRCCLLIWQLNCVHQFRHGWINSNLNRIRDIRKRQMCLIDCLVLEEGWGSWDRHLKRIRRRIVIYSKYKVYQNRLLGIWMGLRIIWRKSMRSMRRWRII